MEEKKYTPCVIIPGFGQSKAELYDENGNSVRQVWPLKADVKGMAKKILKPYLKTVLCRKDKGFTDTAYQLYREILEPLAPDKNGDMKHRVRAVENRCSLDKCSEKVRNYVCKLVPVKKLAGIIGEDRLYFFAYNAFDDAYVTAEKLDDFIALVKRETGSEKVNLLSFSMGGAVCTAYFDVYRQKNEIENVFYLASAMLGSQLQADLLERNFDKNQGYSLLEFFTTPEAGKRFRQILSLTTWDVRYALLYRSIDAVFDSVMMNSAGMWELLPVDRYEELAAKFISGGEYAGLKKRTDRFLQAQKSLAATIGEMRGQGVKFWICAGYGCRMMALSAAERVSSDLILDVSAASFGAVSAERGEKLPPEKLTDKSVLSPDGSVDASTCLLPESTWLFRGVNHRQMSRSDKAGEIIARAFTDPSFKGVSEEFPTFQ